MGVLFVPSMLEQLMGSEMGQMQKWGTPLWLIGIIACFVCILSVDSADAAFATKFSFTAGELYTDNVFFTKDKEHDFVTTLTPTFTILYAPTGQNVPTLNLNISPTGAIFARHPEENNFGSGANVNYGYTWQYSPRVSFYTSDVLSFQGRYRLGPLQQGTFQVPNLPTSPPPTGSTVPGQGNQNLNFFNSGGRTVYNNFNLNATYLFKPDLSATAYYNHNFIEYLDAGGTDLYQTFGFRGVYNWRKDHNLHAGYWVGIYNSRNEGTNVLHTFDFGDDYFSDYQFQLTPTLSLSAHTGLSFNFGHNGPPVYGNSHVTITKLWERAQLSASVHNGLTSSYGVGSISQTTSFNTQFSMQLTEKSSLLAGVNFPLYNTDNGNFKTFQGSVGVQYRFNPWLWSNLFYNYLMSDASTQAANNSDGILQAGKVTANSVYLSFTVFFNIWPNTGLTRDFTLPSMGPAFRTPFPNLAPAAPSTSGSAPSTPATPTTPAP